MKNDVLEYEGVIKRWVFLYASTSDVPVEELEAEGRMIFVRASERHDETSSEFVSYLWVCLKNGLMKFVVRNTAFAEYEEPYHDLNPRRLLIWREMLENFSEEAKEVAGILLSSPVEILGIAGTESPRAVRGAIYRHLNKKGWGWRKIYGVFNEIREVLGDL